MALLKYSTSEDDLKKMFKESLSQEVSSTSLRRFATQGEKRGRDEEVLRPLKKIVTLKGKK